MVEKIVYANVILWIFYTRDIVEIFLSMLYDFWKCVQRFFLYLILIFLFLILIFNNLILIPNFGNIHETERVKWWQFHDSALLSYA